MPNRNALKIFPVVALALVAMAACQDGQVASAPKTPTPPPGPTPIIGMIQGRVEGSTFTASYLPLGSSPAIDGTFSPMIYGSNAQLSLSGTVGFVDVVNVSRTWTITLIMRNLINHSVGSNYGAASPLDSTGVFFAFANFPVVTLPVPCSGCGVRLNNASGVGDFDAMNEPYFWVASRPQATTFPGAKGKDTTATMTWKFRTTSFVVPDTVHAFTFSLMVSAAWPRPDETSWLTVYDGTTDSFPDTQAEPRWRRFAVPGQPTLGVEAWTGASAELALTAANTGTSIYFSRRDSLGINGSAFMDVRARDAVSSGSRQAAFGFAEPTGGKQVFVAITNVAVGFATFTEGSGQWTLIAGSFALTGTNFHTYRVRKIGNTSVALCVDGTQRQTATYASLQGTTASWNTSTAIFGLKGRIGGSAARYTAVSYTIGADGGGCT